MKKIFSILICLTLITQCFADSPLTSTFFATAYSDQPLIKKILDQRGIDEKYNFDLTADMLTYLDDASVTLDKKVALINALGWGEEKNTIFFKQHLTKKYMLQETDLDQMLILEVNEKSVLPEFAKKMSNNDLLLLGYLQVMGNYFEPSRGIIPIESAFTNNLQSEATGWVYALLAGQIYLDLDWCEVYVSLEQVSLLAYTTDLVRDDAKSIIWEYIGLYQNSCVASEYDDELVDDPLFNQYSEGYYLEFPVYTKKELQIGDKKENSVDLELLNSNKENDRMLDEWVFYNPDLQSTIILLKVRNNGNKTSAETNLVLHNFADDNDGLGEIHYQVRIPEIAAGETATIEVELFEYWIYDPNASFEIILDFDGNIQEKNEENNKKTFFEAG